jgi:hypothetical protein
MGANEQSATFAVNLGGDFAAKAKDNAQAADKLAGALDGDLASLKAMQGALRNLQQGSLGATKEARALKEQIAAQKASIGSTQAQLLQMGAGLRKTGKSSKDSALESASGFRSMIEQLKGSSGAAGSMTRNVASLAGQLGKAGLYGAAALAVIGIVAVASATVLATLALAKYALGVQDARRSEMIRLEGLTKLPNYFGIAAGKATDLQASIDRVSEKVALGRDKIYGYAESLYRAGLRGKNLDAALSGTAIRASVLGEEMGAAFAGMAAGAALTGQSVIQLAKRTEQQFGGLAKRQLLSFSVQLQKARENIDALFRNVKIEGFLGAFSTITKMLSQSTASGRALRVMFETLLNPLFGSAESGASIVKRLFQGIIIGALGVTIVILKLRNWWRDSFKGMGSDVKWANVAVYVGIGAVVALTGSLLTLTAVAVAVGVALAVAWALALAPMVLITGAVLAIGYGFVSAWEEGKKFYDGLKNQPWAQLGVDILLGILSPLGAIGDAGEVLGKKMLQGFKKVWEISSPSRVAGLLVERDIAGGAIGGAVRAGPRVGRAMGEMLQPSAGRGFGRAAVGRLEPTSRADRYFDRRQQSSGRSGRPRISIAQLHVHTSSDNPKQAAIELYDELCTLVEGAATEVGAMLFDDAEAVG